MFYNKRFKTYQYKEKKVYKNVIILMIHISIILQSKLL